MTGADPPEEEDHRSEHFRAISHRLFLMEDTGTLCVRRCKGADKSQCFKLTRSMLPEQLSKVNEANRHLDKCVCGNQKRRHRCRRHLQSPETPAVCVCEQKTENTDGIHNVDARVRGAPELFSGHVFCPDSICKMATTACIIHPGMNAMGLARRHQQHNQTREGITRGPRAAARSAAS